ncbi:uncharacterized protein [Hyperolius riggenbachi]|uniref:uncharacterized protein n=1 Tax=Hyperolius riggenbachi TaxID=752182 RepID=UPI0035A26681
MDITRLKQNIRGFSLDDGPRGSQGYNRVLLQVFGYTGHGKSAFINSCLYALDKGREFTEEADVKQTLGGNTMVRNAYKLTDNITIVDNRGFCVMSDFEKCEVIAQLGNFIPIGKKVEWKNHFREMMEEVQESEMDPQYTDFIVPIFVYSVKHHMPKQEMPEVKRFMEHCTEMTGVSPIVVLTFKTYRNYDEVQNQFRQMGAEMVMVIENYTKENHKETVGRTTDILMVIDRALSNVKFRMELPRDPKRERLERKKFLINYIHMESSKHLKEREEETYKSEKEEKARESSCSLL